MFFEGRSESPLAHIVKKHLHGVTDSETSVTGYVDGDDNYSQFLKEIETASNGYAIRRSGLKGKKDKSKENVDPSTLG